MIAISIDSYNQTASTEIAEPLRAGIGGDERAKVLVIEGDENSNREKILLLGGR